MSEGLVFYTVYERPRDYPDEFVIRRSRVVPGNPNPVPDPDLLARGRTLDEAKALLPTGLVQVGPHDGDDPCILEVWL